MTLYLVIHEEDSDAAWGCDVKPFLDHGAAMAAMRADWEETLKEWEYDNHDHTDDDEAVCDSDSAVIREGDDYDAWRIEKLELPVSVAVEVCNGMVKNIYANADVSAEVFDLDVSAFPDAGELEEADRRKEKLDQLRNSDGWRNVW